MIIEHKDPLDHDSGMPLRVVIWMEMLERGQGESALARERGRQEPPSKTLTVIRVRTNTTD
jgi:hypothetical protein